MKYGKRTECLARALSLKVRSSLADQRCLRTHIWYRSPIGIAARLTRLSALFAVCTVALHGCTLRLPDYPVKPIGEYAQSSTRHGLTVAIHPILDDREAKRYFGTKLRAENILAILVVVENSNSASSFVVSPTRADVRGIGAVVNDQSLQRLSRETGAVEIGLLGVGMLSPVLIVSGVKALSNSREIQHALAKGELRTQTLSPGETIYGFLYFHVPKSRLHDEWSFRLEALDLVADESVSFEIKFGIDP